MTLARLFLFNAFSYAYLVRRTVRALALRTSPARGLRLMRWCSAACLRCFPSIRESIERAVAHMLSGHLNDDPRRVRQVAAAIVRELFEAEFAGLKLRTHSLASMKAMIDAMACEGDAQLRAALARGGPLMLAGLHFGNLMLFVTKLRFLLPADRKLIVVLHKDAPGAFFDDALRLVSEYGAGQCELIDIEERVQLRRLLTSLRREQPVFLLFSDLHGKFGKTNRCRLGGRWVRMAGGGVKLAVENGIPVLVAYATGVPFRDRCTVHFAELETCALAPMLGAHDDASPVRATHQRIVDRLEQALVRQPEQWHFWEHFTPYLMPSPLLDAAARRHP
ncbi:hypothetical protein WJ32_25065 [Burkholderia ubonensis]|uniref:Lipid A biosynthesis lauroyl acyltransferase n=1 Tax=Burkholderia ubonensis TaxID=101571 RepID=A0A103RJ09_9BURK|nr:hypothetical protein [Burkholderia ubonensis]AOJ65716.1 hypothetical protein WJ32_25065 [Burkholderia ubonensis]KVG68700.1 hypothetical protein WJ33_00720 [Burkholderia ubonensis]